MNSVARARRQHRLSGQSLACLLVAAASSSSVAAADPIASSNFAGVESPLFENGAWAPIVSLAPDGMRFGTLTLDLANIPQGIPADERLKVYGPTRHRCDRAAFHALS